MGSESVELEASLRRGLEAKGIKIGKFIGRGSYARVYLAIVPAGAEKREVALKIIDINTKSEYVRRFLPREIEIVKQLQHANIVRVFQIHNIPEKNVTIFETEFCAGGDLLDKIKRTKRLQEVEAKPLFRQLVEALKYLEAKEVLHRDLKCENVFLDRYDNVKLGDFGFARILKKGEVSRTFCGSKVYVAPEILRGKDAGKCIRQVDIWSAGIVLFIMVTGVMPYDERNVTRMIEKQLSHTLRFPRSLKLTFEVKQLIYCILHPVSTKYIPKPGAGFSRLSYNEMLNSDWLKGTPYIMKAPLGADQLTPCTTPTQCSSNTRKI